MGVSVRSYYQRDVFTISISSQGGSFVGRHWSVDIHVSGCQNKFCCMELNFNGRLIRCRKIMHFPTLRLNGLMENYGRTWSDFALIAINRNQVLINVRHKVLIICVRLSGENNRVPFTMYIC